jgi:hypothetical protein
MRRAARARRRDRSGQPQPSRPDERHKVMQNRTLPPVLTMVIASSLIAGCGASAPTTTGSSPSQALSSASAQGGHACRSTQLQLSAGPRISEATEQHTLLLVFRNVSATKCVMRGYPAIALADRAGHRLDFSYSRRGDQMLSSAPPGLVTLPPGGLAYSAVNKNSCVGFAPSNAASADVTPPGQRQALVLKLPHYPVLGYCGASDPGHTIDIAPVEPTSADVLAHG